MSLDISERLLVAGKHLGKCLAGYRDNDLRSAARSAVDLADLILDAADEIERLRAALIEIRDHWANQYDHPRKECEMYRGPYGIGVTDGHRACTIIAEKALALPNGE